MVTAMDDAVGLIVEALKQKNLIDNTIIVFTADVSNLNKRPKVLLFSRKRFKNYNFLIAMALNFFYCNK